MNQRLPICPATNCLLLSSPQRLTLTTPSRALEPRRDIITAPAKAASAAAVEGRNGDGRGGRPETTKTEGRSEADAR